jgi:hypothetical protein
VEIAAQTRFATGVILSVSDSDVNVFSRLFADFAEGQKTEEGRYLAVATPP